MYPDCLAAEVFTNGLLFSVCGPLGMPTFSTAVELFDPPVPPLPLLQATRPAVDRMPARAKAAVRLARMDPPSWVSVRSWDWAQQGDSRRREDRRAAVQVRCSTPGVASVDTLSRWPVAIRPMLW